MAEHSQKRGKQRDGEGLGSAVDFLLANARLVLGVGGAAILGIATLAVKRVRLGRVCLRLPKEDGDETQEGWWDFLRVGWNPGHLLLYSSTLLCFTPKLCHSCQALDV
jgi:hypothetical protein